MEREISKKYVDYCAKMSEKRYDEMDLDGANYWIEEAIIVLELLKPCPKP